MRCRKLISFVMMTCLLFLATSIVKAQAATECNETLENLPGQVIVPMWDYTNYTNTTLTISGSGIATATGVITGYQDITTSFSIYLYLQQYKNSAWTTIDSWYEASDNYRGMLVETDSNDEGAVSGSIGYSVEYTTFETGWDLSDTNAFIY